MHSGLSPLEQGVLADNSSEWAPRSLASMSLDRAMTVVVIVMVFLTVPLAQYALIDAATSGLLLAFVGSEGLCVPIVLAGCFLGMFAIGWALKKLLGPKPYDIAKAHDIAALHQTGNLAELSHYQRSVTATGRDPTELLQDDILRIEALHCILLSLNPTSCQPDDMHQDEGKPLNHDKNPSDDIAGNADDNTQVLA